MATNKSLPSILNKLVVLVSLVVFASLVIAALQVKDDLSIALNIPLTTLPLILILAFISYFIRFLKWHVFLRKLGVRIPLARSFSIQLRGFSLCLTPGRAGEVFKLHLLKQEAGESMSEAAPVLVMERLTEGFGFLLLTIISGLMVPAAVGTVSGKSGTFLFGAVAVVVVAVAALRRQVRGLVYWGMEHAPRKIASAGPVRRFGGNVRRLLSGSYRILTIKQVAIGTALTAIARTSDGLVLYFILSGLGFHIPPVAAIFAFAASGLVGGLSMLPGGVGAFEFVTVTALAAFGVDGHMGLAAALAARLFIFWLWIALGLALLLKHYIFAAEPSADPELDPQVR